MGLKGLDWLQVMSITSYSHGSLYCEQLCYTLVVELLANCKMHLITVCVRHEHYTLQETELCNTHVKYVNSVNITLILDTSDVVLVM